jgi:GT2 family glycosyltransferase
MDKQLLIDISVIICAYTEARWENLVEAVKSLRRQDLGSPEIIVVIDHNPALFVRAHAAFPDAIVIESTDQRGLSGARNSGIATAQGAVIAFLDDDAVADHDWLRQLANGYQDPQVVGVGGTIVPYWQTGRPNWFPDEFNWVVGCTYRGMPKTAQSVRNMIGCNMSFRREVFAAVGNFVNGIGRIEAVPVGCEETELCIRVHQHWPDRVLMYLPQARVQHQVTPARARWSYFAARCRAEGKSKALVSQLVGASDGLSSERSYTLRVLPMGVLYGLRDAVIGHDIWGLARAAAIITGLMLTTGGYVHATLALRLRRKHATWQRKGGVTTTSHTL